MTMQRGTARGLLRDRLDEASATGSMWTDAQLDAYLNEGVRDVARRAETLTTKATIVSPANTQTVSLASLRILRIYRLEHKFDSEDSIRVLEYRDFNNMDEVWWESQTVTTGTPFVYTTTGYPPSLSVVLYPTPTSAGSLYVHYYATPVDIATGVGNDTTNLSVPDGWEDIVIDYAEFRALRMDRDDRWQAAFQIYEANVVRLLERSRRWAEATGSIVNQTGTPLPAWLWNGEMW